MIFNGDSSAILLIALAIVLYAMGFRLVKKGSRLEEATPQSAPDPPTDLLPQTQHDKNLMLIRALDAAPFTEVISADQRDQLRAAILSQTEVAGKSSATVRPATAFTPPERTIDGFKDYRRVSSDQAIPPKPASISASQNPSMSDQQRPPSVVARRPVRKPASESIRSSWDPAIMMLYLGALLVVIAGLIFATYNWGALGGWQKMGLLAAATIAFLVAGFVVRRVERLKPAATTFMTVGALLVPANFLAAYTVFDDVQPALPLLLGAIATTVIHGLLSYQPNANWFRYTAVGSAIIAVATIPAAIGFDPGWGGVVGLLLVALLPDGLLGLKRFRTAWLEVNRVAAPLLGGFAFWHGGAGDGWVIAAALVAASMVAIRFSHRYPQLRVPFLIISDVLLIAASMQIADNFAGDRWVITAGLLALTLILMREARRSTVHAAWLEFAAAASAAMLIGDIVRVLGPDDWAVTVVFSALTVLMLVHAMRHPRTDFVSHAIAALALPVAIGTGVLALNGSDWSVPIAIGALTLTLIAYGIRHRALGDIPFAVASITGIITVILSAWMLDVFDSDRQSAALFVVLGLALTAIANIVLTRFRLTSSWLRNLLRIEALPLFFVSFVVGDFDDAATLSVVALAMFWTLWVSRSAIWSLPLVAVIAIGWLSIVVPAGTGAVGLLWWHLALATIVAAMAWQLDLRSLIDERNVVTAGVYAWLSMTVISVLMLFIAIVESGSEGKGLECGIVLIGLAALFVVCYNSTQSRQAIVTSAGFALFANIILLFGAVSSTEHVAIGAVLLVLAVTCYWWLSRLGHWLGFVALVVGLAHILMVIELSPTRVLFGVLAIAWVLASLGIIRWRTRETKSLADLIFWQAMLLHLSAPFVVTLSSTDATLTRENVVLVLISLAGVVATYGGLRRNREIVLIGSGIGMSALMLQINLGSPGNIHVYTVPLAMYLISVGMLLRKDPRIANLFLSAGSGMLVIPAMMEALTTGSINWLWVALAEALALFLFGTILRLRIPTAAGIIAVSVIALRMLVFAVSALASWVSILAIGVSLLVLGTLWLIFREPISARFTQLFSRWQSYD